MAKAIIHTATGEFRDEKGRVLVEGFCQGWTASGCPASPNSDYSIVIIPNGTYPDTQSQKWNGNAIVTKSADEINSQRAAKAAKAAVDYKKQNPHLTWKGLFTDVDPAGSDDCIWLRYSTGFQPTVELKSRKGGVITVLLTQLL